jgi:hypothetical protein
MPTPALHTLAKEGVILEQAYSQQVRLVKKNSVSRKEDILEQAYSYCNRLDC